MAVPFLMCAAWGCHCTGHHPNVIVSPCSNPNPCKLHNLMVRSQPLEEDSRSQTPSASTAKGVLGIRASVPQHRGLTATVTEHSRMLIQVATGSSRPGEWSRMGEVSRLIKRSSFRPTGWGYSEQASRRKWQPSGLVREMQSSRGHTRWWLVLL